MTTSNKCQGTVHTCKVDFEGFGTDSDFDKTQRARLDRLKEQYKEWSKKYSQRESMDVDEYIQGLDEMASMSSELDAIMKQTGPMDPYGRARSMTTEGALIYYEAESGLLNNIASAQGQYLRVGINVAPDNPVVAENRWNSVLTAIALMKSSGMGGPRAAIGASRIASMRNTVAAYKINKTPAAGGVAVAAAAPKVYKRNMSERRKALLRDADDPNSGLTAEQRKYIKDNNGYKVPKDMEVSHETPLYTAKTYEGKQALDVADNMKTLPKIDHRARHKVCGDQYHDFPM